MKETKTVIIGAGGLGRSIALTLSEYIRRELPVFEDCDFTFLDHDEVEDENVWTQGYGVNAANLIQQKTEALEEEFSCPLISGIDLRVESKTDLERFNPDCVICAVDNLETRRIAYQYCKEKERKFIDGRVNGRTIMVYDDTCPDIEEFLAPPPEGAEETPESCLFQWEKEARIVHTTPLVVAGVIVQFFMNWRRGEPNVLFEAAL